MKIYSKVLAVLFVQFFIGQHVYSQVGKSANSVFVKSQIKPRFSEMSDYGLPVRQEGVHEFPGGKAPASNQINADGSVRVGRTGEVTVPAQTYRIIERSKEPDQNPGLENKSRVRKKK